MPFYLTPEQDDFNKILELQACITEALYDVDSIVADPDTYTEEELAALHSQITSNLEQAWELLGGSEDQLLSTMMQISHVVAQQFNKQEMRACKKGMSSHSPLNATGVSKERRSGSGTVPVGREAVPRQPLKPARASGVLPCAAQVIGRPRAPVRLNAILN